MGKKTIIGGLIALALVVLILLLCFWGGRRISDWLRGAPEPPETSQPEGGPPVPPTAPTSPAEAQRVYLALGNPSGAAAADPNNYLLVNNYFALSYSRDRAVPNWAAWRLSPAEVGGFPRPNPDPFRPDDRVPKGWPRVTPSDYNGSGFDKGHLCPSADRSASSEGMTATFLMTNMTPQTGDLNRGPWQKFEAYLRTLVTRGNDVYVYAGAYGVGGKLKNKVTIPTNDWKVALVVPSGTAPTAANENTRVIAVNMPNVRGILRADWQVYRTTARQIEVNTGYNLFSNLPQNVQEALENKVDAVND